MIAVSLGKSHYLSVPRFPRYKQEMMLVPTSQVYYED